jgi:hypothetical protein
MFRQTFTLQWVLLEKIWTQHKHTKKSFSKDLYLNVLEALRVFYILLLVIQSSRRCTFPWFFILFFFLFLLSKEWKLHLISPQQFKLQNTLFSFTKSTFLLHLKISNKLQKKVFFSKKKNCRKYIICVTSLIAELESIASSSSSTLFLSFFAWKTFSFKIFFLIWNKNSIRSSSTIAIAPKVQMNEKWLGFCGVKYIFNFPIRLKKFEQTRQPCIKKIILISWNVYSDSE